jgi:hypothetical protein
MDTQTWLLAVRVSSADETDRQEAPEVLSNTDKLRLSNLKPGYADGGLRGKLNEKLKRI